jgi:GDP-4-dehydro-6-deoxy-D-mannose reductase
MADVCDVLTEHSCKTIARELDESRMRPSDVPLLIGDNTKLKMYTDWEPDYNWEESLIDLLEYWRENI